MRYLTTILGWCACVVSTAALAQTLTFEEMSSATGMTKATLSPDGRHIAAILFDGLNRALIVIDTDTLAVKSLPGVPREKPNGV